MVSVNSVTVSLEVGPSRVQHSQLPRFFCYGLPNRYYSILIYALQAYLERINLFTSNIKLVFTLNTFNRVYVLGLFYYLVKYISLLATLSSAPALMALPRQPVIACHRSPQENRYNKQYIF